MISTLVTLALLGASAAPASPGGSAYYTQGEAQALFAQGNQAFAKDDYAGARDAFDRLLAHGFGGADVHYNLGTVELAQDDLGHAVLDLLRARREGGNAPDVEANLALARSRQLDKVIGAQAEDSVAANVAQETSTRAVGWALLTSWVLAFAALLARRALRARKAWLGVLCGASFAISVLSGAFLAFQAYVAQSRIEAVVLDKTVPARELPNATAKVTFEVHAGLEVQLGEHVGDYVRIRLPNGLEGWALRSGLEAI